MLALATLISAAIWRTLDEEDKKSTVIVIRDSEMAETTTVSFECSTALTIKSTVSRQKTEISSETAVTSSTFITTVAPDSEQPATEEILYLDINNASFDDLVKLNGIGEYRAGQIIAYREEYGGFNNIEELINVSGIGEKIFNSIRDNVYVENPVYYDEIEIEIIEESEVIDEATEPPVEVETAVPALTLEECTPINLNAADVEVLTLLPYVDEEIAREIIELRENLENFKSTYEILYIDKLTPEQWDEVLKYVCV